MSRVLILVLRIMINYTNCGIYGQAIGYKEVLAALAGECTLDEARDEVKRRTRHYAKRQLSWLKRDGRARWIDVGDMGTGQACELIISDALEQAEPFGIIREGTR